MSQVCLILNSFPSLWHSRSANLACSSSKICRESNPFSHFCFCHPDSSHFYHPPGILQQLLKGSSCFTLIPVEGSFHPLPEWSCWNCLFYASAQTPVLAFPLIQSKSETPCCSPLLPPQPHFLPAFPLLSTPASLFGESEDTLNMLLPVSGPLRLLYHMEHVLPDTCIVHPLFSFRSVLKYHHHHHHLCPSTHSNCSTIYNSLDLGAI